MSDPHRGCGDGRPRASKRSGAPQQAMHGCASPGTKRSKPSRRNSAALPQSSGQNRSCRTPTAERCKLGYGSMDRRFFHRLGASQLARTICAEAGATGIKSVYGVNMGTEPEQFAKSKYIIAWAANIHGNNIYLWPFIEEAHRNGAKLVVIDPYRTR